MNRFEPKGALERGAAADLWRRTLSQVPTVFGRLVYLCSLRDHNTGQYEHHGLAQYFGDEEADRVLRESHQQVFSDWLCFALEQQKNDLDDYLSALDSDRTKILRTWIRLAPYRNLVPAGAREAERALYLADLGAVLALLAAERGIPAMDPEGEN